MLPFKPVIRGIDFHFFRLLLNLYISTHQHHQFCQIWPLLPKIAIIDEGWVRRDWSSFQCNFFFWRNNVCRILNWSLIILPLFSLWCCWNLQNQSDEPEQSSCWFSQKLGFLKNDVANDFVVTDVFDSGKHYICRVNDTVLAMLCTHNISTLRGLNFYYK